MLGLLNLLVKLNGGQEARYHVDHVCASEGINNPDRNTDNNDPLPSVLVTPPVHARPPGEVDEEQMVSIVPVEPPPPAPGLRRSKRLHRPPDQCVNVKCIFREDSSDQLEAGIPI